MQKTITLLLIIFLCSCTQQVVKPQYIDREIDLNNRLDKNFKALKEKPTKELVSQVLNDSYVYNKRIDSKLRENNKRALGK